MRICSSALLARRRRSWHRRPSSSSADIERQPARTLRESYGWNVERRLSTSMARRLINASQTY
jgi:hypothetical protein